MELNIRHVFAKILTSFHDVQIILISEPTFARKPAIVNTTNAKTPNPLQLTDAKLSYVFITYFRYDFHPSKIAWQFQGFSIPRSRTNG